MNEFGERLTRLFQMEGKPPKLWLVWIYRNYSMDPWDTKRKIEKLFGKDAEVSVS